MSGTKVGLRRFKKIALLMGGWSSEREVSLSSGNFCADALERAGYEVTRVDVQRNIARVLEEMRPEAVFNSLHGPFGEDGTIQGVLEILNIPYTHSGVMASALAMDKQRAKIVAKAAGIPVAPSKVMHRLEAAEKHAMSPPYVVKPVTEGSSYGVLIVREDMAAPPQELYSDDWRYGDEVMVERYVGGRELTCGVMGNVAFGVLEIIPTGPGFYDYDAKYVPGGSKHICPAKIKRNIYQKIQTLSLKAHTAIGCKGVSRSDYRLDDGPMGTGELVWLEINTQPGMTPTSLLPDIALHAGHSFEELLTWMVEDASCRR